MTCCMCSGHTGAFYVLDGSESYQRGKVMLPLNVTEVGSEQSMNGHYLQVCSICQCAHTVGFCRGRLHTDLSLSCSRL